MNRFFLVTLWMLTLTFGPLQAQVPSTDRPKSYLTNFYYDLKWQLTKEEKAYFRREAMFDFTNMVFDGAYRDYNKDNILIAEGYYENGVRAGLQTEYYPNRKIKSLIEYHGAEFSVWEYHDEAGIDSVKQGTGSFKLGYFYQTGLVSSPVWRQGVVTGTVQKGKRVGVWVYNDLTGVKTDEEYYAIGRLSRRIHYSDQNTMELDYGKLVYISISALFTENMVYDQETFSYLNELFESKPTYPASFHRGVTYVGGLKHLILLLSQSVNLPADEVSIIRIRVDDHGKITKYSSSSEGNFSNDQEAISALRIHEHRFFPAMKDGQPIPNTINIPIGTGAQWVEFVKSATIEDLLSMN